ncbi:MAG: cytochrome oxidase Cu insertion factor (SCO1/SenC/PrrC family), partial [Gammaproteobacteria bacterium]
MIITISLVLSFLVALNFLLLILSCNKTTKKVTQQQTTTLKAALPQSNNK